MSLRRFTDHKPAGFPKMLDPWHPAITDGTTLYPARRINADHVDRLLKSGHHSRKIGKTVQKGRWRGMPIYTLSLEERATCPRTCGQWSTCYGNSMNWSERIEHGPLLEAGLDRELRELGVAHPAGFVVRLHVLGDFYSPAYVHLWDRWLTREPALHIFGYTAWQPDTPIGAAIAKLRYDRWDRFAIRTSEGPRGQPRATVLDRVATGPTHDSGIVCPAQTGRTECCATCGLCWATKKDIVFLRH